MTLFAPLFEFAAVKLPIDVEKLWAKKMRGKFRPKSLLTHNKYVGHLFINFLPSEKNFSPQSHSSTFPLAFTAFASLPKVKKCRAEKAEGKNFLAFFRPWFGGEPVWLG